MVFLPRLLAPVVALTAAVQGVFAAPAAEAEPLFSRQNGGTFPITGVTEGGNAARLEIRQLQGNGQQWNLFLQAMERLQAAGQSQLLSYYSIAGIHGRPYRIWDGANGAGGAGYCPHSSNLFGPWHRPYLALIEQRIQFYAVQVANEYPVAARTVQRQAASTLRLPYWDWASNQVPVLPNSVTAQTVSVTRPNGQQATIPNPLFQYRFHPLSPSDFGNSRPISVYQTTKRWPAGAGANAQSQNGRVENNLRGSAGNYRSRVFNLLSRNGQTFNHFSNHGSGSTGDTLESVHDAIHSAFGPNSHMVFITFSSFDPIFWFHHCNVDRIMAMWQQLYPNSYVTPFRQNGRTFTVPAGSTQDVNSPLTPFHRNAQGQFWTSASARNVQSFGYTYNDLSGGNQAALRTRVNQLYGPQAAGVARGIAPGARALNKRVLDQVTVPVDLNIQPGDLLQEYIAKVVMPLNPLGGTYSLATFLGPYNKDPNTWMTDDNYVGSHAILAMAGMTDTTTLVTGEIPLTQALLKKFTEGKLTALDASTVISYVHDNLQWAIEMNGKLIDSGKVPQATVTLISNAVKAPTANTFPTVVDTAEHGNVTETMNNVANTVANAVNAS